MGHFFGTVFLGHIVQHRSAAVIVKIGVNIWQRNTVRVQKSLKQQVILHRVNLGDAQAVGHCRSSGRSTAGTNGAAQFGGHANVVLHNQEVTRETHVLDGFQLKVDSFAVLLIEFGPSFLSALINQITQVIVLIVKAVGQREIGQDRRMVNAVDLHLVQNLVGVLQGFRDVGEHLIHLLLCLEPLLLAVHHHVLVGELLAR